MKSASPNQAVQWTARVVRFLAAFIKFAFLRIGRMSVETLAATDRQRYVFKNDSFHPEYKDIL
jgi:hypothetical protein